MDLSFDAWTYSTQISEITKLAKQFPQTPIVVDHLATPAGLFGPIGKKLVKHRHNVPPFSSNGSMIWQFWLSRKMSMPRFQADDARVGTPILSTIPYCNRL